MDARGLLRRAVAYATLDLEAESPLGRRFMFSWRNRITHAGRMLFLVLLLVGPAAAIVPVSQYPLYYFAVFVFSLLLVGRLGGLLFAPRVEVRRDLPERCAAGAELTVVAAVRNAGPLGVFDLAVSENMPPLSMRLGERTRYLEFLPRGESATLTYTMTPTARGAYDFTGPVALTAFPFGIYNHALRFSQPHRMLVYPRFMSLDDIDLPVGRKHQPGGLQLVSHLGDSEEFLGNREYVAGDRLRDIDHRAWARVGFPVVREFQQEYLCRVALIADTFVPWYDKRGRDDLEAALSLAAAVAEALSRREYIIDLFAAGPDLYHFQAGRSLAYLDNILDILACIEPCRESPFAKLAPAIMEEIGKISTAVVVLLDWNEEREQFVRALRQYGVESKILVVRTAPPTFDPAGFAAGPGGIKLLTPEQVRRGTDRL